MKEEQEKIPNFVRVKYALSSTSGKVGYEMITQCSDGATEEEMQRLANLALKTAQALRDRL